MPVQMRKSLNSAWPQKGGKYILGQSVIAYEDIYAAGALPTALAASRLPYPVQGYGSCL